MFDNMLAIDLARAQFAFTFSFHFIFPALSIGLASYLAVLEGLWLRTGREVYLTLFEYWLKKVARLNRHSRLIPNPLVFDFAGDSQAGGNLFRHRNLWEDCDGVGGWASG